MRMWAKRNASSPADLGAVGPDELLAHQRLQACRRPAGRASGGESSATAPHQNDAPHDRRPLDHRALLGLEPVQAGGQQRVDGRRDRDARQVAGRPPSGRRAARTPSSTSIRSVSSTNSGLPSATSAIRARRLGWELRAARPGPGSGRRSRSAVSGGSVDHGRVRLRGHPPRADLEQLRPRLAEEQHRGRRGSSRRGTRADRGTSASPQWMSSKTTTSGLRRREVLEQLAHRPERLLDPGRPGRRRAAGASRVGDESLSAPARSPRAGARRSCAGPRSGGRAPAIPAASISDRRDRPERDALAVGQAAALHDRRARPEPRRELGGQARLPDAGRAHDGDELARPRRRHAREAPLEDGELALAADERRVEPAAPAPAPGDDLEQRHAGTGSALPLSSSGPTGSADHGVAHEPVGRLADEDLAGLGRLLEPRGDVDRVADDERLAALPGSAASTSPVLTPVRTCQRDAPRRARARR